MAGRDMALFWNPSARNKAKAWTYDPYWKQWRDACGPEVIAPQAGTRHSVLSRLAEVLTPHELKSQSQHRDLRSLDHYTVGAKPNHAAMVRAIRPKETK
ncbi:MAG: hypothetical protein CL908_00780 [Deltaproteobacteria bacterium]|jgi:hypothetical protein|nr:hypothetical protein [Deltaproteobacteria bacterium]